MDEKTLNELHAILQERSAAFNKATRTPVGEGDADQTCLDEINRTHKEYIEALGDYNKALAEFDKNKA